MSGTMTTTQRLGDGARLLPVFLTATTPTPVLRKRPAGARAFPGSADHGAMTTTPANVDGLANAYVADGAVMVRCWGFAATEGKHAIARPIPPVSLAPRRPPG